MKTPYYYIRGLGGLAFKWEPNVNTEELIAWVKYNPSYQKHYVKQTSKGDLNVSFFVGGNETVVTRGQPWLVENSHVQKRRLLDFKVYSDERMSQYTPIPLEIDLTTKGVKDESKD